MSSLPRGEIVNRARTAVNPFEVRNRPAVAQAKARAPATSPTEQVVADAKCDSALTLPRNDMGGGWPGSTGLPNAAIHGSAYQALLHQAAGVVGRGSRRCSDVAELLRQVPQWCRVF